MGTPPQPEPKLLPPSSPSASKWREYRNPRLSRRPKGWGEYRRPLGRWGAGLVLTNLLEVA